MDLSLEICRSANRINLAAQFSMTARCPRAARRTVVEAARIGQNLLDRLDASSLRTLYEATIAEEALEKAVDELFQRTVGDFLQMLCVHQIPIARLGTALCGWGGTEVPFGQFGDSLDDLNEVVSGDDESVRDHLLERRTNDTRLLLLSDAFYGLTVVMAAINSRPGELNGFRREIACAGASVLLDSSKRLLEKSSARLPCPKQSLSVV